MPRNLLLEAEIEATKHLLAECDAISEITLDFTEGDAHMRRLVELGERGLTRLDVVLAVAAGGAAGLAPGEGHQTGVRGAWQVQSHRPSGGMLSGRPAGQRSCRSRAQAA